MISIRVNSELAHPFLLRYAQQGVAVEISPEIEGFSIQVPGEDEIVGSERKDFMRELRDLRHHI